MSFLALSLVPISTMICIFMSDSVSRSTGRDFIWCEARWLIYSCRTIWVQFATEKQYSRSPEFGGSRREYCIETERGSEEWSPIQTWTGAARKSLKRDVLTN